MADGFRFYVREKYSRGIEEKLNRINDNDVRIAVNDIIANAIKPYVPKGTGALSKAHVYPKMIVWGENLPYAKYQYYGVTYGPNLPIYEGSKKDGTYRIIGWYSREGKSPTGGELGTPGFKDGWTFGYHTEGTMHHWTKAYEWALKSKVNKEISLTLNKMLKNK